MKFSKFHSTLLIATLLFGGIIFSSVLHPVSAQTAQPTATSTLSPPNPTIVVLENIVATQKVEIAALQSEQSLEAKERDINARDVNSQFREINSQWKSWLALTGIAGGILAILGIKSARDLWDTIKKTQQDWKEHTTKLEKEWEKRSSIALDQAVYKLDMANIPILLPADENVGSVHRLLQQRKFEKIKYYKNYNELEYGVLVVSLKGKSEEEQKKTLDKFKEFIATQQPSALTTGFIVYAPDRISVPADVMNCHDNLVTANFPATVVSNIFAVGRGIEIPISTSKEETL